VWCGGGELAESAQRYAAEEGVAIVAPDTSPRGPEVPDDPDDAYDFGLGAGFYVNATQFPWAAHYRMYDYIVDELPRVVADGFPVDPQRTGIFGHSMGGHGALTIALRNPGRYRSVSAFAPISSPINCPWGQKALGGYLGPDRAAWRDHDACDLIGRTSERLPLLVDQGDADGFLATQLRPDQTPARGPCPPATRSEKTGKPSCSNISIWWLALMAINRSSRPAD